MKVYRIERKVDGNGVYSSGAGHDHVTHEGQPAPWDDFYVGRPSSSYHYGFRSVEQMHNWFFDPRWYEDHSNKYVVRVYDTKTMLTANYQVAFIRSNAHLVDEIPLTEILPTPNAMQLEKLERRRVWLQEMHEAEQRLYARLGELEEEKDNYLTEYQRNSGAEL